MRTTVRWVAQPDGMGDAQGPVQQLSTSTAAPRAPSRPARWILTQLGTRALAKRNNRCSRVVMDPSRPVGIGVEEVRQPQLPHQLNRAWDTVTLSAPARRRQPLVQAGWAALTFQQAAEGDVLHQYDEWRAADALERLSAHEDTLIAGGDAGQPGTDVHQGFHHPQQWNRTGARRNGSNIAPAGLGPRE